MFEFSTKMYSDENAMKSISVIYRELCKSCNGLTNFLRDSYLHLVSFCLKTSSLSSLTSGLVKPCKLKMIFDKSVDKMELDPHNHK